MIEPIKIGSNLIDVAGFNLSDPSDVERMLLEVEKVQGSTDLEWLDSSPPEVKQAVMDTITRPAALIWEETESDDPDGQALSTLERPMAQQVYAAGRHGKWVETTARYRPGWITYYWFKLRTHFWWDGAQVTEAPVQEITGDGSWGWAYEGTTVATVEGWPTPEAYRSVAQGEMNMGRGADWVRRPRIEHLVHGNGKVEREHRD